MKPAPTRKKRSRRVVRLPRRLNEIKFSTNDLESELEGIARATDRVPTCGLFIDSPLRRCGMTKAQVRARKHSKLVSLEACFLDVEAELHYVAIFDDVFLAFDAQLPGFARFGKTA